MLLAKTITVTDKDGQQHQLRIREWTVAEQEENEFSRLSQIAYVKKNVATDTLPPALGLREVKRLFDAIVDLNWGDGDAAQGN